MIQSACEKAHSVSKEGVELDPNCVEKVRNSKSPSNKKLLETFVGLANFYGRMITDFATKMLPFKKTTSGRRKKSRTLLET